MKHSLKNSIISGTLSLLLLSACSKTEQERPVPVTAAVKALATQPKGTVVYTSNGYTLTFTNNDATFDQAEYQRFINTFFTVYPQLLNRFWTGARKSVTFVIDPTYTGVAYTS